jgi:hypothetical protein
VQSALDSKAMRVEKRSTGRDELDAAFEILTKWFSRKDPMHLYYTLLLLFRFRCLA